MGSTVLYGGQWSGGSSDTWRSRPLDLAIRLPPRDVVVPAGFWHDFTMEHCAAGPALVRWRKDGVPLNDNERITGSATNRLTIVDIRPTDAGLYDAMVTFGSQSVVSEAAMLSLWSGEPCYADCDTSTGAGVLDIFDFLCFNQRFVAQDPWACGCDTGTGPMVCDIFDFLCFLNVFREGCR